MTDYKIIQTINGPEDVKKLSMEQLEELASEIREALFNRLTKIGGHFGPNFGMVEAEIAMHYVFWQHCLYRLNEKILYIPAQMRVYMIRNP